MADKLKTAIRLKKVQARLNNKSKKPHRSLTTNEKAICRIVLNIREYDFHLTKDMRFYAHKYGEGFQYNPLFVGSSDQKVFFELLLLISNLNEKLSKLEDKYGLDRDEVMSKNMELNTPISSLPQY